MYEPELDFWEESEKERRLKEEILWAKEENQRAEEKLARLEEIKAHLEYMNFLAFVAATFSLVFLILAPWLP